jgi:hypothetical protein
MAADRRCANGCGMLLSAWKAPWAVELKVSILLHMVQYITN